ncbi:MAG: polysaccharide biosynthesis protein [Deltaproteobacteria bacterium]|nr:polysaccharide biosynthesis protein [Deltaproteobacteria bacterium]|tara:strand:+ start:1436 stop:2065 length:630 start_codon:yes stop_codon:yes gene_type:complete
MPVGFKSRPIGPLALVLLAGLWLSACAPQASVSGYEQLNDEIREELQLVGLGVGDVFSVSVYGEKELSGEHQISPEGTVDVPLIGRVEVQGKTPSEIARVLEERFLAGYLKAPYVSVYVKQYNSKKIFVLGMVRKPGTFPLTAGMNVVEAVTMAGGFTETANANFVVVTRKQDGQEVRIPVPVEKISKGLAANLDLKAGDIVFVPDRLL